MKKIKFVPWILRQTWVDCPEADLKEDLKRDIKSYGFKGGTFDDLQDRMYSRRACHQALETLSIVYQLYQKATA
jgi:hypothetical protein